LTNVAARAHYERYQRLKKNHFEEAKSQLRYAEISAAAAVWEEPYDLTYWRDYVKIAAEQRVVHAPRSRPLTQEEAIEQLRIQLLRDDLRYPDLGKKFSLTDSAELRHVGNSIIRGIQGDAPNAREILTSWILEPAGRTRCAAAAALLELDIEADRFGAADDLADAFLPICTGGAHNLLAKRHELLSATHTPAESIRPVPANYVGQFRTGMTIEVRPPLEKVLDIANRILRDPSRLKDWDDLRDAAGTDIDLLKIYDKLLERSSEAEEAVHPTVLRALAFRRIECGEFEDARIYLEKLIARDAAHADAEVLLAAVLIDTDTGMHTDEESQIRLQQARQADPRLSACIDDKAIQPCLQRLKDGCKLTDVLCGDADNVVYWVWTQGWPLRPNASQQVPRLAKSVNSMAQKMAVMQLRDESMEQRLAVSEERIAVIVQVRLPEVENRQNHQEEKMEQLRREERARWEQYVPDLRLAQKMARDNEMKLDEVVRLLKAQALDVAVLKALLPKLPQIINVDQEDTRKRITQLADEMAELRKRNAQLADEMEELNKPALVHHIEVLQHLDRHKPDEIITSTIYVLQDLALMALAPPGPQKLIPLLRMASDFAVETYIKWKK